jgi:hypothetical protein
VATSGAVAGSLASARAAPSGRVRATQLGGGICEGPQDRWEDVSARVGLRCPGPLPAPCRDGPRRQRDHLGGLPHGYDREVAWAAGPEPEGMHAASPHRSGAAAHPRPSSAVSATASASTRSGERVRPASRAAAKASSPSAARASASVAAWRAGSAVGSDGPSRARSASSAPQMRAARSHSPRAAATPASCMVRELHPLLDVATDSPVGHPIASLSSR